MLMCHRVTTHIVTAINVAELHCTACKLGNNNNNNTYCIAISTFNLLHMSLRSPTLREYDYCYVVCRPTIIMLLVFVDTSPKTNTHRRVLNSFTYNVAAMHIVYSSSKLNLHVCTNID